MGQPKLKEPVLPALTPSLKKTLEAKAKELLRLDPETITEAATEVMRVTSGLTTEENALFLVIYSGMKWESGYDQGKNDPDFEQDED